jgi:chromosome partitioning protein
VIDKAKDDNSELQVRISLTRIGSRAKVAAERLAFRHEQKLPVAYRRATGQGAIVQEPGKDPSSSQEMEAFLAEVTT